MKRKGYRDGEKEMDKRKGSDDAYGRRKEGREGWKRKIQGSICLCSPIKYRYCTHLEGMEWQGMGKGESGVSLLLNDHDDVKLQS